MFKSSHEANPRGVPVCDPGIFQFATFSLRRDFPRGVSPVRTFPGRFGGEYTADARGVTDRKTTQTVRPVREREHEG